MPGEEPENEAVPPSKPQLAAQLAEAETRELLKANKPPVNFKTGRVDSKGKMPPLWSRMKRSGDCRIGSVVKTNPLANPNATLEQHYQSQHMFGAFHPMVRGDHASMGVAMQPCAAAAAIAFGQQLMSAVPSRGPNAQLHPVTHVLPATAICRRLIVTCASLVT